MDLHSWSGWDQIPLYFIFRMQRPRSAGQYISQQEFEMQDEEDITLGRKYDVLEKFNNPEYLVDHGYVKVMEGKGEFGIDAVYEGLTVVCVQISL